jgi:hypothetical protein
LLGQVEIVHQEFSSVRAAEMVNTLQVCLPIANALVIKAVYDVFAQTQIRQIDVWTTGKQIRRNQVRRVDRSPLIATCICMLLQVELPLAAARRV